MSQSLKILCSYRVEQVRRVSVANGFLVLTGGYYQNVRYVLLNGVRIDNIALQGSNLYVEMPSGLQLADVHAIYPISETEKVNKQSVLRFGFGPYPAQLEGVNRLVQLFIKVLFTSPGSNIMFRTIGGGLRNVMKRGYGIKDYQKILPDIVSSINKAADDVKDMQRNLRLPMEERLIDASLLSASPDASSGSIECIIKLNTQAGNVQDFALTF